MGKKTIIFLAACLNFSDVLIITDFSFPTSMTYYVKKKKEIIPTSFWGKTETLQSNIVESEMCQSGKIL